MSDRAPLLSILIMVGLLHHGSVVAQAPHARPIIPSFRVSLNSPRQEAVEQWGRDDSRGSYWLEGGAIGAVVLGVASYFGYKAAADAACSGSDAGGCNDYRTAVTVGGAAVGFLVGALIGRGHLKHGPTTDPPSD